MMGVLPCRLVHPTQEEREFYGPGWKSYLIRKRSLFGASSIVMYDFWNAQWGGMYMGVVYEALQCGLGPFGQDGEENLHQDERIICRKAGYGGLQGKKALRQQEGERDEHFAARCAAYMQKWEERENREADDVAKDMFQTLMDVRFRQLHHVHKDNWAELLEPRWSEPENQITYRDLHIAWGKQDLYEQFTARHPPHSAMKASHAQVPSPEPPATVRQSFSYKRFRPPSPAYDDGGGDERGDGSEEEEEGDDELGGGSEDDESGEDEMDLGSEEEVDFEVFNEGTASLQRPTPVAHSKLYHNTRVHIETQQVGENWCMVHATNAVLGFSFISRERALELSRELAANNPMVQHMFNDGPITSNATGKLSCDLMNMILQKEQGLWLNFIFQVAASLSWDDFQSKVSHHTCLLLHEDGHSTALVKHNGDWLHVDCHSSRSRRVQARCYRDHLIGSHVCEVAKLHETTTSS